MPLIIKKLHMDPHVSLSANFVTEYSCHTRIQQLSRGHWPGMDITRLLLAFEQGTRSLEDYVHEYLDLAYFSDFSGLCPDRLFLRGH